MLTITDTAGRTWTYSTTPPQSVSSTPLGNTTARTEERGRMRAFAYEALGGLDSVTDLSGAAWDCSVLGPDESRAALRSAP
jgi:YD repeat-containing protein